MRVAVTGARGMLGQDLLRVLPDAEKIGLSSSEMDIRNPDRVKAVLRRHSPDVVIHAAASTDVDACELHPEIAFSVNGLGTRNVAVAAQEIGAALAYVSTDYVFDGAQAEPYLEFDATHPINVYGKSKLAGEGYVRDLCSRYYVIRTSWLFGRNGKNFVRTIARLGTEREEIRVVADQVGSPTYTLHLARKIVEIINARRYGIYHVTNSGSCSWFQLAQHVLETQQSKSRVVPIETADYPVPAPRPRNSVLRNLVLQMEGMELLPPWQDALAEFLAEVS